MIQFQSEQKEDYDENSQLARDRASVISFSHKAQNAIELHLLKDQFSCEEAAQGYVLINIVDSYDAKRLTLSIIGETLSRSSKLVKRRNPLNRIKTTIANVAAPSVQRTFTAVADSATHVNQPQPLRHRQMTRSLNTMVTVMGRKPTLPPAIVSKASVVPDPTTTTNRELFCHYNVSLFTFKTSELPSGAYKVPFSFTFPSDFLPTADYKNNEQNLQLAVTYKMIAELEENQPEPEFDAQERLSNPPISQSLKSVKEIKIYPAKALVASPTIRSNPVLDSVEVSGKMRIPTLLCFRHNEIKLTLRLENSNFRLGQRIKYYITSQDKALKKKKTKVFISIIEELSNFGTVENTFKHPLDTWIRFLDKTSPEMAGGTGSVITGDVILKEDLEGTFKAPNLDINHYFEAVLSYGHGVKKPAISLRIPIVLTKKIQGDKGLKSQKNVSEDVSFRDEDDHIMHLPLAKFKLDERFNLLTKTAAVMEEVAEA